MGVTCTVWAKNPREEDLDLWLKDWAVVSLCSFKVQVCLLHVIT